jgi:hypothetical protein
MLLAAGGLIGAKRSVLWLALALTILLTCVVTTAVVFLALDVSTFRSGLQGTEADGLIPAALNAFASLALAVAALACLAGTMVLHLKGRREDAPPELAGSPPA